MEFNKILMKINLLFIIKFYAWNLFDFNIKIVINV
jgi:hypothetical protein